MPFQHLLRPLLKLAAIAAILGVFCLSWMPGPYMVRTHVLSGGQEHWISYLMMGACVAAAWPQLLVARTACLLIGLAGLLELGQHYVPGRQPAISDFSAGSLGALCGILLVGLLSVIDISVLTRARRPGMDGRR